MSEELKLPPLPEPFDLPTGEDVYHFVAGNMNSVEFEHPIPEGSVFGRPEKFSANDTYCMSAHDIASAVTFTDLFTERQVLDYARSAVLAERERCAKLCDSIENERWDMYKRGTGPERASDYVQGQSDGACSCAAAIRKASHALKE